MEAIVRFLGELRSMVAGCDADGLLRYPVTRRASIKDVIEALGVPHTEIERIVVLGRERGFTLPVEPGQAITVHPADPPLDVTRPTVLRPDPLARLTFAADANVGRLATLLRLLGYDTTYAPQADDAALAAHAAQTGRVVLSRDRGCLKRTAIVFGHWIRANDPQEQLRDVARRYGLRAIAPFRRCLRCNEPLQAVAKKDILAQLLPKTKKYFDAFMRCPHCGRIYWAESHYDGMRQRLEALGIPADGDQLRPFSR